MNFHKLVLNLLFFIFVTTSNLSASTDTKIAVLDFELNDITSLPNTATEIIRTASFKPLFEKSLEQTAGYKIVQISANSYKLENAGFGYLYKFHDVSASLGKQFNADWIIVGQHSKGSFLYSYLMINLINIKTNKLVAHYDIELKGTHKKVIERGIKALTKKITKAIKLHSPEI